jgi:hypothetical protein
MAMEDEFWVLMQDEIVVEQFTGKDNYGNKQYAAPVTVKGRMESVTKAITGDSPTEAGKPTQLEVSMTFYTGTLTINALDKIVLPTGAEPTVISVVTESDENGPHHQVISMRENV